MADLGFISASNGSGEAVRASVTGNRSISSTTLTVDSVLNWPAKFVATTGTQMPDGTLDPSSVLVFLGHLSGQNIEIDLIAPGYQDDGNSVGDVVLIKPATVWADELVAFLAESHKDDGSIRQTGEPNEPGLLFSASSTQPSPDPDGRTIVWFEPLA